MKKISLILLAIFLGALSILFVGCSVNSGDGDTKFEEVWRIVIQDVRTYTANKRLEFCSEFVTLVGDEVDTWLTNNSFVLPSDVGERDSTNLTRNKSNKNDFDRFVGLYFVFALHGRQIDKVKILSVSINIPSIRIISDNTIEVSYRGELTTYSNVSFRVYHFTT